jgi:ATP-binding cassette, subfamily F, member 3
LRRLDPTTREQEFRDFLGGFDFRGKNADSAIAPFSGGEKARLALALLVWQKPNLLLLDEPTNHLDIEMREAVAEALQDFDGTLVVVAHDRHLLKACADQLWLVADGKVGEFDGDLDDYKKWAKDYAKQRLKKTEPKAVSASPSKNAPKSAPVLDITKPEPDRKDQKRTDAEVRQKKSGARKPLEQKLAELEKKLKTATAERDNIEQWLATEDAYADANKPRLGDMLKRQAELVSEISDIEWKWLDVQQKLEEDAA